MVKRQEGKSTREHSSCNNYRVVIITDLHEDVFDSPSRYISTRTRVSCVFEFADYRGDVKWSCKTWRSYTKKAEKKNRIRWECSKRKMKNYKGAADAEKVKQAMREQIGRVTNHDSAQVVSAHRVLHAAGDVHFVSAQIAGR